MERFRERLVNFRSPQDLEAVRLELADLELHDPSQALPAFVVRSVLEGLQGRISDRPLPTETWEQVKDALSTPLERVLDALLAGKDADLLRSLTHLVRTWARTHRELVE